MTPDCYRNRQALLLRTYLPSAVGPRLTAAFGRLEYARYESRPPPYQEPSGSRSPSPV